MIELLKDRSAVTERIERSVAESSGDDVVVFFKDPGEELTTRERRRTVIKREG